MSGEYFTQPANAVPMQPGNSLEHSLKIICKNDEMDASDRLVWHSAHENQMTLGYNCCKSW